MRRTIPGVFGLTALLFFLLLGAAPLPVSAETVEEEDTDVTLMMEDSLMDEMDLEEIQKSVDELLGNTDLSVQDSVDRLMAGENIVSGTDMKENVFTQIVRAFREQKETWVQLLVLVLAAALLSNFASLFENGQMGEMAFYMIYLLVFALLLKNFQTLSGQIAEMLQGLVSFMKALIPAYYLTIAAASGVSSAAMFYQVVLIAIWLVEHLLIYLILPGIHVYLLLSLVNQLSKEDFLSHMAALLKNIISWILKTALGLIIGMQLTRNLVAPALDSLKRTIIGKTASAIPGVGNAIDAVTEMVIGSAVLIRNCVGAVAVVILFLCALAPVIQVGVTGLAYRFLAAFAQPVSDRRMVGCLNTMGVGCGLLLKLLITTEVLFMLTIAILAGTAGG